MFYRMKINDIQKSLNIVESCNIIVSINKSKQIDQCKPYHRKFRKVGSTYKPVIPTEEKHPNIGKIK